MQRVSLALRTGNRFMLKANTTSLSRYSHPLAVSDGQMQKNFSVTTNRSAESKLNLSISATLRQVQRDARQLCGRIHESVISYMPNDKQYDGLRSMLLHHFDGEGKFMRPTLLLLLGRMLSSQFTDTNVRRKVEKRYETIAMCAEMIHTASLMHDDLLDSSDTRRGKPSAQHCFGQREAVLAGDLLLSVSSRLIASLGDALVVEALSKVLDDLVSGELLQLGKPKQDDTARFTQYIGKCYLKTGSLFANCARAVAIVADANRVQQLSLNSSESDALPQPSPAGNSIDNEAVASASDFGRHFGIAFQLVDDLLDLVATQNDLGKPAGADLLSGVVTGPVLFAARQNAELNAIVTRGFTQPEDADRALRLVASSDGVAQTRKLARQYADEAIRQLNELARRTKTADRGSRELAMLEELTELMLVRAK